MTSKIAKRRGELELLDALQPIAEEHEQAKATYVEALAAGNPAAIREAKRRKNEAARRLNDTRAWLRTEAAVKAWTVRLEQAERSGHQADADKVRAQLERWEARARKWREALAALQAEKGDR